MVTLETASAPTVLAALTWVGVEPVSSIAEIFKAAVLQRHHHRPPVPFDVVVMVFVAMTSTTMVAVVPNPAGAERIAP
jgi:hypothetical protein